MYFDSLIHSGIEVSWPKKSKTININDTLTYVDNSTDLTGAIIQDSPYFDNCSSLTKFCNAIQSYKGEKKIFGCVSLPQRLNIILHKEYINEAYKKGIRIFKIHPRFINIKENELLNLLEYMIEKNLSIQLCTYGYSREGSQLYLHSNHFWEKLQKLALKARKNSIMLMHMGGTNLIQIHNYIRHCDAFIGDLSMTILKYKDSSITQDILFLFKYFDRRICIGSDYPEYTPKEVSQYLDSLMLTTILEKKKTENILQNNVIKFAQQE